MRYAFAALLIALTLAPSGTAGDTRKPAVTLPVSIYSNHIYLKVRVNGSQPLDFILDTGATDPFLNARWIKALGLATKSLGEQGDLGTGEGSPTVAVAKDVVLDVGGI